MSVEAIALIVVSALAAGAALWRFGRWLSGSWEVLDDDQVHAKLGGNANAPLPLLWLRLAGWLGVGPRQMTYRRDKRGRFRRVRR